MARELTVDEIMAILPETPRRIAALTEGLTPAELRTSPEPGAWSINDVLAHLRACHDVLGGYMLRILAEDTPTWKGMNPRTWMKKTDYPDWEFAPAFEAFRKQRAELLAVLEPLPPDAWDADRQGDAGWSARSTIEASAITATGWPTTSGRTGSTSTRIVAAVATGSERHDDPSRLTAPGPSTTGAFATSSPR